MRPSYAAARIPDSRGVAARACPADLAVMTTPSDPIELTAQLMAIDSTSGNEQQVVEWFDRYLAERGWRTTRIPVNDGRANLFATSVDRPRVTLSTHLDTVPPFIPPRRDAHNLYGRGACDAKGLAASMVCAAETLRDERSPVALLFVVGEEVTHDGAHAANDAVVKGIVPDSSLALVNGEPTENTLGLGTKGAVRVIVRTSGQAAHSAYPHLGRSATRDLVHLLAELDHIEFPSDGTLGHTTVNIGALAGGVADNVVAPWAEARMMIRLVTPVDEVRELVEQWANGRASLEWGPMVPPVKLGVVDGFKTSVVAFATDIPALTNWGTPYLYGPGSIHVAHGDDEYVSLDDLRAAPAAYARIAREALRSEQRSSRTK